MTMCVMTSISSFVAGFVIGVIVYHYAHFIRAACPGKETKTSECPGSTTASSLSTTAVPSSNTVPGTTSPLLATQLPTRAHQTDRESETDVTITSRLTPNATRVTCPPCTSCKPCPSTKTAGPTPNIACRKCVYKDPVQQPEMEPPASPFLPLTRNEVLTVNEVLKSRHYVAIFQRFNESRISHLYLFPPEKEAVLQYLDNDGPLPKRYAKVHVLRTDADPPDVMFYKVGPLDSSVGNITVEQIANDGTIPFNIRPFDFSEEPKLVKFLAPFLREIAPILRESFDGAVFPQDIRPIFNLLIPPNSSSRTSLMTLHFANMGIASLRLLPVSCTVHHPGVDPSTWKAMDWFYLSQGPFNSAHELMNAYNDSKLRKITFKKGYREACKNEYGLQRNMSLQGRKQSDVPPPTIRSPESPRYLVRGNRVEWMGWTFEFTSDPIRGPAIFDIRFLNNRIAYEISLQDVTLLYHPGASGHGPFTLADTAFLLGTSFVEPRFGVDCPGRGTRLTVPSTAEGAATMSLPSAACVFEADGQTALWRHEKGGLADHYLVVRSVLVVGNYDYTVEWNFHLDGTLRTWLSASGYLYGAFWDEDEQHLYFNGSSHKTPFGYRVNDFLLGPIHDHAYSFKVDLDVAGTNNSFQNINWKAGNVKDLLRNASNQNLFFFNQTRFLEYEILEKETKQIWDSRRPQYWTVINEGRTNAWGAPRGYRLIPHGGGAEVLTDHPLLETWDHLGYQLAVSRRREEEPYATNTYYSQLNHGRAPDGTGKVVFDGESVRNTDLVVWLSEKFYHVPSAEDVPVTTTARTGFTLKPFNMFDRTPTFDLPAHYEGQADPYSDEPCLDI